MLKDINPEINSFSSCAKNENIIAEHSLIDANRDQGGKKETLSLLFDFPFKTRN